MQSGSDVIDVGIHTHMRGKVPYSTPYSVHTVPLHTVYYVVRSIHPDGSYYPSIHKSI